MWCDLHFSLSLPAQPHPSTTVLQNIAGMQVPVDLQGACSVGAELLGSSIKYVQTEGESYFKCQNSPKCGSGLLNSKAETMPDLEKLEKNK